MKPRKYLARGSFGYASALSSIDHNGKNWITERKRNLNLLSPRTILLWLTTTLVYNLQTKDCVMFFLSFNFCDQVKHLPYKVILFWGLNAFRLVSQFSAVTATTRVGVSGAARATGSIPDHMRVIFYDSQPMRS